MTVAESLRKAAQRLAETSETPRLDAELLMAHALAVDRSELLLRHMAADAPGAFGVFVERRIRHEPVAYIIGRQDFYGLPLAVTPAVLIPRADSETLIDAARQAFNERAPARILDLGTGSGALLIAALSIWPKAEGIGIDRDPAALAVAADNASRLVASRAAFIRADWREAGWSSALGTFDLILANPPYVEDGAELKPDVRSYEPAGALFAGADGLDDYRVLVPQLSGLLAPDGVALVEIGATQGDAVSTIADAGAMHAALHYDLGGRPRALKLTPG